MTIQIAKIINRDIFRLRKLVAAFTLVGVVAGCSSIPDAINPAEWLSNSLDLFTNDDSKPTQESNKILAAKPDVAVYDKNATFPKLSHVDKQQKRAAVRENGLVADVEGRKYAPSIPRQGEATNVLSSAPPKPSLITAATVPKAQPKTPELAVRPSDVTTPTQSSLTMSNNVPGQDNFQNRFASRLAEIKAEAAKGYKLAQYSAPLSNQIRMETVVVSSLGTESNYGVLENRFVRSADTIDSRLTYLAKPMTRLSDNVVRVATIRFKNGSAKLSSRDRKILAKVVRLKKERGGRIHIVGHASSRTDNMDPVSHKMINFRVSAARADVVARELQRLGTDKSQLQVDAVSDSVPEFMEVMPTGEAGNRRTEIYLDS
jgi:flagellar motor protein MotB